MKIRNAFWVFVALLLTCLQAQAKCKADGYPFSPGGRRIDFPIYIGTISPSGVSVGGVIATYRQSVTSTYPFDKKNYVACHTGDDETFKPMMNTGSPVDGFSNVYRTNLAGIGYRLTYADGVTYAPHTWKNPYGDGSDKSGGAIYFPSPGEFKFELIKTSDTFEVGALKTGEYGSGDVPGFQILSMRVAGGGSIQNKGCTVDTGSRGIRAQLGAIAASDFTGIASAAASKSFKIGLTCDNPTVTRNINIRFDGTPDSSGQQGTLALTNSGSGKTAKGVGVQILLPDSSPVHLGKLDPLGLSSGASYSLDFFARYIQTQASVTAGNANSTATFTLEYK